MTNQLSKKVFPKFFSLGQVRYSFEKRGIVFTCKVRFSLLKVQTIKKNFFEVNFPQTFSSKHVHCCFDPPREHICQGTKKTLQLQNSYKKQNFSGKRNYFPQIIFLDPRVVLWEPWKKFSVNSSCFLAQSPKKIETMCKVSNIFFPQSLPRLRRLQFWQLWRIFPPD